MTKNKTLKNVAMLVLSLFILIGSVFAFIQFAKKNKNIVFADEISTSFNSSSIFVPTSYFNPATQSYVPNMNDISSLYLNLFKFSISPLNNYHYSLQFYYLYYCYSSALQNVVLNNGSYLVSSSDLTNFFDLNDLDFSIPVVYSVSFTQIYHSQLFNFMFDIYSLGLSNCNFTKVVFDNRINEYNGNLSLITNSITYYNSINESISFSFPFAVLTTDLNSYSNFIFTYRNYYFEQITDTENYNFGYSNGYDAGLNAGYNSGYASGVDAVSRPQYEAGYSAGYSRGVAESNNYSFTGLIGAVIDAPISYLRSLFGFDILGVNILNFLTGLFTVAIVLFLVRIIF